MRFLKIRSRRRMRQDMRKMRMMMLGYRMIEQTINLF